MKLNYSSNNSGGSWWLSDKDWFALEQAGWDVDWYATREDRITNDYVQYGGKPNTDRYPGGRFLDALASNASKIVASKDEASEAVEEFERLTNSNAGDKGCSCCGQPHYFSLTEEADCEYCDPARKEWKSGDPHCNYCGGTGVYDKYVSSFDVHPVQYERGWD